MEMYEVGGCVRDEIMGVKSKDIDYSFVFGDDDLFDVADPYTFMVEWLENLGVRIIRGNDGLPVGHEFVTARGIAPKDFPNHPGRALDFVLARREGEYSDGRRPDSVEPGTLMDDLSRRDFTMNAIAKDSEGNYIDPFNGQQDIADRIIQCVGDPMKRLTEDALRAVRALRFAVTKGFMIHPDTLAACNSPEVVDAIKNKISDERIQVELSKMFRFDTIGGLDTLGYYFNKPFRDALFSGSVSLDATMKQRGRGK